MLWQCLLNGKVKWKEMIPKEQNVFSVVILIIREEK